MKVLKIRDLKVEVIAEINDKLVAHGLQPLSPDNFDTLYDMDIDELYQARTEVYKAMDAMSATSV